MPSATGLPALGGRAVGFAQTESLHLMEPVFFAMQLATDEEKAEPGDEDHTDEHTRTNQNVGFRDTSRRHNDHDGLSLGDSR
jgi:hypothetical protein